jgi:putative ATP-dependent endonuclease of OLD family
MRITHLAIENFRALRNVDLPLGPFVSFVGENNTGKSSFLHAVIRFCDGQKLVSTDFYDEKLPVRITATLSLSVDELDALVEEHRIKIAQLLVDGHLRLVRVCPLGGKTELRCFRRVPKEERWREEVVDGKLKGLKADDIRDLALKEYPELLPQLTAKPTQKEFKEIAGAFRQLLPADRLEDEESPLPTGFDNSIAAIMPEPIYIEAVKDFASAMRTADAATFGKVLGLLLNVVQPKLADEKALFAQLERKLNVVKDAGGTTVDERLPEVRELESTIQGFLTENFPEARVGLTVPAPEVKAILQGARLAVHDGAVEGPVETVGDGLKRSVMFSLFRAYAELARRAGWNPRASERGVPKTVVLYEEPELYLHPQAQQILFNALGQVSNTFQVIVTTHSPLFFSADRTSVFVKMTKPRRMPDGGKPHSSAAVVNLARDRQRRDVFQILCYENCNVAFFATGVLLVEGNSDIVAMQHLARVLSPEWDFDNGHLRIVRVNGKGNIERFKTFFSAFGITPYVLADLDVLVDGFDKLGLDAGSPLHGERSSLLQEVDKVAVPATVDGEGLQDKLSKFSWRERAERFYGVAKSVRDGRAPTVEDLALVQALLADELEKPRRRVLREEPRVRDAKLTLLAKLRSQRILVFEKGTLEDYYPPAVCGQDKFCKAEDMCKKVSTKEQALALASAIPVSDGSTRNELEAIFARVFWGNDTAAARPTEGS